MKRSWGVSTGMDPHIRATCTSYEYMSPADACHVWLKAVTFTVLVRLVKSKRSASDLVPYHVSAQLILLTYYSRYIGGTAVDKTNQHMLLWFIRYVGMLYDFLLCSIMMFIRLYDLAQYHIAFYFTILHCITFCVQIWYHSILYYSIY